MSRIDDLIEVLCPKGVDFRELGTLGKRNKGTPITASKMKLIGSRGGPVRVFAGGQTIADVSEDDVPAKDIVRVPSIIVKSRGYIGFAYYDRPFTHKTELWSYSIDDPSADQKFVYYYLLTQAARLQEIARGTSVKLPQLGVKDTDTLRIPVPPLDVQREIVRVLDQFTLLEAELEAELEARRRQYEHYRSEAFSALDDNDVRWSTLAGISSKVSSGGTPSTGRDSYYGGDIPWLRTQEVDFGSIYTTGVTITAEGLRNSSAKWIPERCVVVAMYGATAAKVAINEIALTTNQACCNLQIDPEQAEHRYVFYWVASQYERLKSLGEGSQSNLNAKKVRNFPIPVPALDEQRRIVSMLDKFDALVNDLSIGLPAERAARRKQYEYYRDRLLTFEEAVA